MTFDEYQKFADSTARYPDSGKNFIYPTLGLAGEAGEVAEKIKRVIRERNGVIDDAYREVVLKELGDVLWYTSQLAREFGSSIDEVARMNVEKLASRRERNQLHGDGDNR